MKRVLPEDPAVIARIHAEYAASVTLENDVNELIEAKQSQSLVDPVVAFQNWSRLDTPEAQCRCGEMLIYGHGIEQDYQRAVEFLEKAAQQGNALACKYLGDLFRRGQGVERNYAAAFKYYEQAAALGENSAWMCLGEMYSLGQHVKANPAASIECYEQAAKNGYSLALVTLGGVYQFGDGVSVDIPKALKYYQDAAKQESAMGHWRLAHLHENGVGVEKDAVVANQHYIKAHEWGLAAVEARSVDMLEYAALNCMLGELYFDGLGVLKNDVTAVKYYQASAKEHYRGACYALGVAHETGCGAPKDEVKAVIYYQIAADKNLCEAFNRLGVMYEEGRGTSQDIDKAIQCYETSIGLGNMRAYSLLACVYETRLDDPVKAGQCYQAAADKGNVIALHCLGAAYEFGELGFPKDPIKAVECYQSAADEGYAPSCMQMGFHCLATATSGQTRDFEKAAQYFQTFFLNKDDHLFSDDSARIVEARAKVGLASAFNGIGVIYLYGLGVPKDSSKGLANLKKAADMQLPEANFNLALMYKNGNDVQPDAQQSFQYFHRAASLNLVLAYREVGVRYQKGAGVDRDNRLANLWFQKAVDDYQQRARNGDQLAWIGMADMYSHDQFNPRTMSFTLTSLDLKAPVSDVSVELLTKLLQNNTTIENLSLSDCQLTDKHWQSISEVLRTNYTLKKIDLTGNPMSSMSAQSFGKVFQKGSFSSLELVKTNRKQINEKANKAFQKKLDRITTVLLCLDGPCWDDTYVPTDIANVLLPKLWQHLRQI